MNPHDSNGFRTKLIPEANYAFGRLFATLLFGACCASIGLMVGANTMRNPALVAKMATTLDHISGGRAILGIGAAWNQEESDGLGFPMPPLATRFEMLEETLQIAHAMFQGERGTEGRHDGTHYAATRLLNSPQSLARPRVPIMIGGGGEKKTLRLVAQYADATNVFGGPDMLRRKYGILAAHCEAVGRPFEEIERTTLQSTRLSDGGGDRTETPDAAAERFAALAGAGAQHVIVGIGNIEKPGVDALAARLVELVHAI